MKVTALLMLAGSLEEAMAFNASLFPGSRGVSIDRYGPEGPGKAGTVKRPVFELHGTTSYCIDSPVQHPFTFIPAISIFVDCDSLQQLDNVFTLLGAGGQTFRPPASYGFSDVFAWVRDRYGVSWQLNLA